MPTTLPQSPNYTIGTMLGCDLNNVFTVSSSTGDDSGYDNPPHAPGDLVLGVNGQLWMYVLAATAINQYDVLCIDKGGSASQATNALASTGEYRPGFAQIAIANAAYAWVALGGSVMINTASSMTKDLQTYTSATAGVLAQTSSSQTALTGGVADTTTTTAAAVPYNMVNPTWASL